MAMISLPTRRFWKCYQNLPERIRRLADESYKLWKENPFHPSLEFEEIRPDIWRIKIGCRYRAIAKRYDAISDLCQI
ncbi:hypothetical protein [Desulfonema magnum]|uniref:Uncharacterized protein n=1 Tax=Desulfonema magnum TaxID=45655 RepID=A0A975BW22_9BACT|nr:hypothetical protein [Desulfonema magnum]QTA92708.1 Uncharacterized protein dnm_087970 [Desulfonema magnum]